MKKLILALLVLTAAQQAIAQQMETLAGPRKNKVKIGAYGAPAVKFTSINDKFGVIVGGHGGVLLNSKLMLGVGGYSLVNNIKAPSPVNPRYDNEYLNLWYTGAVVEYIHNSDKLIHWSAGALIGGGGVARGTRRWHDDWDNDWDDDWYDHSGFFVTEPFANVEMNITTFLRIFAGGSYRFIVGSGTPGISNGDISGPSVQIGIKAGKF